jgi:hypothetical protein
MIHLNISVNEVINDAPNNPNWRYSERVYMMFEPAYINNKKLIWLWVLQQNCYHLFSVVAMNIYSVVTWYKKQTIYWEKQFLI